jgi:hypothetical protein
MPRPPNPDPDSDPDPDRDRDSDSDPDPRRFRRRLADRVTDDLAGEIPVSAHLGDDHADEPDHPDARALRERGGGFGWVAFGFEPHSMWDAHVGVLVDEAVVVGVHLHERVAADPPDAVAALGAAIGGGYRYSEAAAEHQYNRPPVPLRAADVGTVAAETGELCREFAPIVDDLLGGSGE